MAAGGPGGPALPARLARPGRRCCCGGANARRPRRWRTGCLGEDGLRGDGLLLRGRVAAAAGRLEGGQTPPAGGGRGAARRPRGGGGLLPVPVRARRAGRGGGGAEGLLRLRPQDAAAHHNLGTVYRRQGRCAGGGGLPAVVGTSAGLSRPPGCGWLRPCATPAACGEAAEAWGQAVRLDPGNAEAAEGLRRARQAVGP